MRGWRRRPLPQYGGVVSRFRRSVVDRFRRFLRKPGSVDLAHAEALLPAIGDREDELRELTDVEFTAAAAELRDAEDKIADAWLVELCAVGREAARRALGERPFDVQLIGVIQLLAGRVVEMATGEGKTLTGALAATGFALRGDRVHVMSVNDYLAGRDAAWMGPVYELLGVSVAPIDQTSTPDERRAAYQADVTYAPVSEVGFDVLRDRLCIDAADRVVPEPAVAIIDEADSVMIDEARVPLVLAGAAERPEANPELAEVVRTLRRGKHYELDDEGRNVHYTPAGIAQVEKHLEIEDLYAPDQLPVLAAANTALHAHTLVRKDVDYVVRDGKVLLVDDSRGRIALLQRWPDGLQAAVETKEGLDTTESGEVLDTSTIQALLRRYPTVCGMTGTAVAAGEQLMEFYGLDVAVVPSNVECVREDEPNRVYATLADKEAAIVKEIAETHESGRPVLVGTDSVAESERIARQLERADLPCVVLNAKNDAEEAAVIAEAGAYDAITVSTQMAGRGTDIKLGGADGSGRDQVVEFGGLYVIATRRHWSSRLDAQLRGRAGRQGDPGGSVLFASLEDELVTQNVPDAECAADAEPDGQLYDEKAVHIVEHAQRVAEGVNQEIHRNTFKYNKLLEGQRSMLLDRRERVLTADAGAEELRDRCEERYEELAEDVDDEVLQAACRQIVLYYLDRAWVDHLAYLSDLREGIHLRTLAREDPLNAYNKEAIRVYEEVLAEADEKADETFRAATITNDGVDLDAIGLKRPTATWTYLVGDNPFGSEWDRALKTITGKSKLGRR
ncbi:MAG: accessory Sec system translocase SecA2 [Streptosporangiales bacterium]|nr:accessory Sec system translocase SecA2 [Streptosporangiales bacterium]